MRSGCPEADDRLPGTWATGQYRYGQSIDLLSIDQHAVGQFESRICGSFRSGSPMGQIVAEFEPAMLVGVLKAAPPGWR
jgi:hypothetical protein